MPPSMPLAYIPKKAHLVSMQFTLRGHVPWLNNRQQWQHDWYTFQVLGSNAVILRPRVLFGSGDAFLRTLSNLVHYLPIVPLFGSGGTKLQPVHVEDVADATARVLDDANTQGKIYELGGPRTYTYRQLLEMLQKGKKRKRLLLPVPFFMWETLAAMATLLPNPPLTKDQVSLMRDDNTVGTGVNTFLDLGIKPRALEEVAL